MFVTREQLFHIAMFPGMNAETDRTERQSGNDGKKKRKKAFIFDVNASKDDREGAKLTVLL